MTFSVFSIIFLKTIFKSKLEENTKSVSRFMTLNVELDSNPIVFAIGAGG